MLEGYGLTEAAPVTHFNPVKGKRPLGSMGMPLPGTLARVMDQETGQRELPPGEVGELAIQGPQVMQGYWQNPQETAAVLRDGWLYTGDLARRDEDGYFYIVERKKDMIISGGYNIYPREVEEVLYQFPGVKEAVAFGVPDAYRGEIVKAVIVPQDGLELHAHEIREFCRQATGAFTRCPRASNSAPNCPRAWWARCCAGCCGKRPPPGRISTYCKTCLRIRIDSHQQKIERCGFKSPFEKGGFRGI